MSHIKLNLTIIKLFYDLAYFQSTLKHHVHEMSRSIFASWQDASTKVSHRILWFCDSRAVLFWTKKFVFCPEVLRFLCQDLMFDPRDFLSEEVVIEVYDLGSL